MESMTREQIIARKEALAFELAGLEKEEARILALSADARLAEELHTLKCHSNHTDQCGWFYEFDRGAPNWNGWAHSEYLTKARKVMMVLPDMSVDDILKVAQALK